MTNAIVTVMLLVGGFVRSLSFAVRADVIYDPIGDLMERPDTWIVLLVLIGVALVLTAALLVLKKFIK